MNDEVRRRPAELEPFGQENDEKTRIVRSVC